MVNELRVPTQYRYDRIVMISILTALFLYAVVALAGYQTYGSDVEDNILINYPSKGTTLFSSLHTSTTTIYIGMYVTFWLCCRECSGQCGPSECISPSGLLLPLAVPPSPPLGNGPVEAVRHRHRIRREVD